MSERKTEYVNTFMDTLAGGATLNDRLKDIFGRVLSRQLDEDDEGNFTPKGAFDTLVKVFTFVATPSGDRPLGNPMIAYNDSYEQAKAAAEDAVGGADDDATTPPAFVAHQADTELTYAQPTQTLSGEDGVADVFVFHFSSDDNGGFASFGGVTVENYSFADGDRLLLIDENNAWTESSQMAAAPDNRVTGLEGDVTIAFNSHLMEDDSTDDILLESVEAYINILGDGVKRDSDFGFTVDDLVGVNMDFATADEVNLVGGVSEYIETLL